MSDAILTLRQCLDAVVTNPQEFEPHAWRQHWAIYEGFLRLFDTLTWYEAEAVEAHTCGCGSRIRVGEVCYCYSTPDTERWYCLACMAKMLCHRKPEDAEPVLFLHWDTARSRPVCTEPKPKTTWKDIRSLLKESGPPSGWSPKLREVEDERERPTS